MILFPQCYPSSLKNHTNKIKTNSLKKLCLIVFPADNEDEIKWNRYLYAYQLLALQPWKKGKFLGVLWPFKENRKGKHVNSNSYANRKDKI